MVTFMKHVCVCVVGASLLASCGKKDKESNGEEEIEQIPSGSGAPTPDSPKGKKISFYVKDRKSLPACESNVLGALGYVSSEKSLAHCDESGEWLMVDLSSLKGADGVDGVDGVGCSVEDTEVGATITCGDSTVVIADGTTGSQGQAGVLDSNGIVAVINEAILRSLKNVSQVGEVSAKVTNTDLLRLSKINGNIYLAGASLDRLTLTGTDLTTITLKDGDKEADLSGAYVTKTSLTRAANTMSEILSPEPGITPVVGVGKVYKNGGSGGDCGTNQMGTTTSLCIDSLPVYSDSSCTQVNFSSGATASYVIGNAYVYVDSSTCIYIGDYAGTSNSAIPNVTVAGTRLSAPYNTNIMDNYGYCNDKYCLTTRATY